ncbi:MAG TPA: hydrogenase [Desulfobulbaceae bacterium]|nr:hydrogenase [Desulfobulbaceae bacterium]
MADFLKIENGRSLPLGDIPRADLGRFFQLMRDFALDGGAVVQLFAHQEKGQPAGRHSLYAVVRGTSLFVLATEVETTFPSLTLAAGAKFSMFEREIAEQYGITPSGHPWLKPLRHVDESRYDYFAVHGEGIHEVGVGPVHAGIIEPGHFRFQCAGEEVLHLEIQLGYQHRGVERLLTGAPRQRLPIICEGIAGDTAIGHSLCFCQAIESLAGINANATAVRTIALELERLSNHVGDLGALSGDVAFAPPAAYFGRLRGEFLNLLLLLSGNRFGKSLVRPGGAGHAVERERFALVAKKIKELRPELELVSDLLFTAHTVTARFERTGTVSRKTAESLGLVGPCARASGLEYDVREFFPTECYASLPGNTITASQGDVYSRAMTRRDEIFHSLHLVETLAGAAEDCPVAADWRQLPLAPEHFVVTLNEGWRGEVSHCLITGAGGEIVRYKVKDPSFHNWMGLAMSLRNQGISDFPLCNKSFNLSYCGFDL